MFVQSSCKKKKKGGGGGGGGGGERERTCTQNGEDRIMKIQELVYNGPI